MASPDDLLRALELDATSTVYAPGAALLAQRKLLARSGLVVLEQLTERPIDAALLQAPRALGPMPGMQEELARLSSRLRPGGWVGFFEASGPHDLEVRVKLAARTVGLVPGKRIGVSGGTLVRCQRPPTVPILQGLAERLPPSARVAVLGGPLTPLASVQSTFGPSVASGYEQEVGKLDLVVYALAGASTDLPRIRQQLAPGATLLVLYPSAPTGGGSWYKPAAVVASVEPFGFRVSGKPQPFPLTPELKCLVFVLREGARVRAAPAPPLSTPRAPVSKPRTSKARAAAGTESPQAEAMRALGKPVALAQRVRERVRAPSSTCGPVTWARPDEPWPTDRKGSAMLHHGTVRVDELPFVPEALADVAMLSVFAPPGAKGSEVVVRVQRSLEGLIRSTSPSGAVGLRAAPNAAPQSMRWKAATDWPTPQRTRELLPASARPATTRAVQDALDVLGAPHHQGLKVAGWPASKPKAGYVMALPAGSFASHDGYVEDLTFLVHRRGARWVVEVETVRSEP